MFIKKHLKKQSIVVSLIVAIVFAVIASIIIIIDNSIRPYAKVLIALDKAKISKHELNACIDIILEEDIDGFNLENISDESNSIIFSTSGKIANIIEPKNIANFVYYYVNPPKSNKPLVAIASNYYTKKFKKLGEKFNNNENSLNQDFVKNLYEILLSEESRDRITEKEFNQDLPVVTEFYFIITKFLYEERINRIYTKIYNDGIELVSKRDLCHFAIELGKLVSYLDNESIETLTKYLLESIKYNDSLQNIDGNIVKILECPFAVLAVFNYLATENELGIVNKFLDYPHVDIIIENFLNAIKATEYYQENEDVVDNQLKELLNILNYVLSDYLLKN